MKHPPLVLVEWVDIKAWSLWQSLTLALTRHVPTYYTVGYLVHSDENEVHVVCTYGDNPGEGEQTNDLNIFPRGTIRAIWLLRKRGSYEVPD